MSEALRTAPLPKRFDHLLKVVTSQRFLNKEGINNEVPFFICPYPPKDGVEMEKMVGQLVKSCADKQVKVLAISLYELAIELLKERGIWDRVLEVEDTISKDELKELLQGVLDPEAHLIPAIADKMAAAAPFDVLFLNGVGEVYPYIRSHNVLNNLQSTATQQPTVMFFPGKYTHSLEKGASLDLFDLPNEDRYYRAYNIYTFEV